MSDSEKSLHVFILLDAAFAPVKVSGYMLYGSYLGFRVTRPEADKIAEHYAKANPSTQFHLVELLGTVEVPINPV